MIKKYKTMEDLSNKSVAIIVYALNKSEGSESGMGYHFAKNLSKKYNNAKIITRRNNKDHDLKNVIDIDLPNFILKIKKYFNLHILYYFFWQLYVSMKFKKRFDIVYQVNFHSDWMPLFTYLIAKESWIVGPIGHHLSKSILKEIFKYDKVFFLYSFLNYYFKKTIFYSWNYLILMKKSAKVYVLNKDHWIKAKQVIYLPSVGVEKIHKSENKSNLVIYVGRLVDLKGVKVLPNVIRNNPDYQFKIIGDGEKKEFLKKSCSDLTNVSFTGWIDRVDVLKEFSNAKFFLFPSFEGAGMVAAEAGSCGCWPVVLKNSGPHELMGEFCTNINSITDFSKINFSLLETDLSGIKNHVSENLIFKNKTL